MNTVPTIFAAMLATLIVGMLAATIAPWCWAVLKHAVLATWTDIQDAWRRHF